MPAITSVMTLSRAVHGACAFIFSLVCACLEDGAPGHHNSLGSGNQNIVMVAEVAL